MPNDPCEHCKLGKKVELTEDIPAVPAGTRGTAQGPNGTRCRVRFENGVDTFVPCEKLTSVD